MLHLPVAAEGYTEEMSPQQILRKFIAENVDKDETYDIQVRRKNELFHGLQAYKASKALLVEFSWQNLKFCSQILSFF